MEQPPGYIVLLGGILVHTLCLHSWSTLWPCIWNEGYNIIASTLAPDDIQLMIEVHLITGLQCTTINETICNFLNTDLTIRLKNNVITMLLFRVQNSYITDCQSNIPHSFIAPITTHYTVNIICKHHGTLKCRWYTPFCQWLVMTVTVQSWCTYFQCRYAIITWEELKTVI